MLLYEQTTTGSVGFQLRRDGVMFVQPVGERPQIYFPGAQKPVEVRLPKPQKWPGHGEPYEQFEDTTWFLGPGLFYSTTATPGHRLTGIVRIENATPPVVEAKLCLEVVEQEQAVASAAQPMGVAFGLEDYVLWVNRGYHNTWYPHVAEGLWKSRRVRALSAKTCELVDPRALVEPARRNKVQVLEFLEKQAHNRSPELEIWALELLADVGAAEDIERLQALSQVIKETNIEVAPNQFGQGQKAVREAYAATIDTIKRRCRSPQVSGNGRDFGLPQSHPCTLAFSRLLAQDEVLVAYNTFTTEVREDCVVVDADVAARTARMRHSFQNEFNCDIPPEPRSRMKSSGTHSVE